MVNRLRLADSDALEAFAAETAVQTSLRFYSGFFFGEGGSYLVKTGEPSLQRYITNSYPFLLFVLSGGQRCRLFFLWLATLFEVKLIEITVNRNGVGALVRSSADTEAPYRRSFATISSFWPTITGVRAS